jgi:hypothetical protein
MYCHGSLTVSDQVPFRSNIVVVFGAAFLCLDDANARKKITAEVGLIQETWFCAFCCCAAVLTGAKYACAIASCAVRRSCTLYE